MIMSHVCWLTYAWHMFNSWKILFWYSMTFQFVSIFYDMRSKKSINVFIKQFFHLIRHLIILRLSFVTINEPYDILFCYSWYMFLGVIRNQYYETYQLFKLIKFIPWNESATFVLLFFKNKNVLKVARISFSCWTFLKYQHLF